MNRPTKEDVALAIEDSSPGTWSRDVLAAEVRALQAELARALLPHWPLDVGTPTEWYIHGQVEWLVVDPRVQVSVLVTPDRRMHVSLTPKPAEPPSSWSATYDTEAVDALIDAVDGFDYSDVDNIDVDAVIAAAVASRNPPL